MVRGLSEVVYVYKALCIAPEKSHDKWQPSDNYHHSVHSGASFPAQPCPSSFALNKAWVEHRGGAESKWVAHPEKTAVSWVCLLHESGLKTADKVSHKSEWYVMLIFWASPDPHCGQKAIFTGRHLTVTHVNCPPPHSFFPLLGLTDFHPKEGTNHCLCFQSTWTGWYLIPWRSMLLKSFPPFQEKFSHFPAGLTWTITYSPIHDLRKLHTTLPTHLIIYGPGGQKFCHPRVFLSVKIL